MPNRLRAAFSPVLPGGYRSIRRSGGAGYALCHRERSGTTFIKNKRKAMFLMNIFLRSKWTKTTCFFYRSKFIPIKEALLLSIPQPKILIDHIKKFFVTHAFPGLI